MVLTPQDSAYTFYESANLKYDLSTFGLPVYSVVFFLGENKINEGTDTTGTLYIEWSYANIGSYILTMVVTTGTMSGSLADLLHAEGYLFSRTWEINIVKADPPSPCEITRIRDTAGMVMVSWQGDFGKAFKSYQIFRATSVNGTYGNDYMVASINSQAITTCFDSTYIGGTSYYKVQVVNSGGYANSYYYQHETNLSKLKGTWLGVNQIKLTWTPSIFYQNFASYNIYKDESGGEMIYSSDSIGSSSFIYPGGIFGGENKFVIRYNAKQPTYMSNDQNESKTGVNVGLSFPVFETFTNSNSGNIVYLLNDSYILRKMNATTGQSMGSISLPYGTSWISLSPQGDLIIFPSFYAGCYSINPTNFSGYEQLPLTNNGGLCMQTTLSGNGTGMGHFDFPNSGYMIFDFKNRTTVFSKITDSISCGRISPDGNDILTGFWPGNPTTCYRILNNNFIMQWTNPSSPCDYLPNSNDVVLFNSTSGVVDIRNTTTGQISHTFTVDAGNAYQDTDPQNPLMLFTTGTGNYNARKVQVFNYLTGNKIFEMVALNAGWVSFALQDSVIYSGAGFKVRMQ